MNDRHPDPRKYSEDEVGLILRRATEMQRAEPTAPDPTGLTLGELEEIAAEAGIDPRLLRRAASELQAAGPQTFVSRVTGAPVSIEIERWVDGEIPSSSLEELVPTIQSATAGKGTASAVGRTLTWSSRSESSTSAQQVLVSARDGQTLIRIEESLDGLAWGMFGGIMGGIGGGVGLGVGGALSASAGLLAGLVAFPLVMLGGSYFMARGIFTALVKHRVRAANAFADQLVQQVEAAVGRGRAELPSSGSEAPPRPPEQADPGGS